MFLSRLILSPQNWQVHQDLKSPFQMHRTLLRAFPDGLPKGESRGVLWRVDNHRRTGQKIVLVQSKLEPDWSKLPKDNHGRDYLAGPPEVRSRDEQFRLSQKLVFRLRANPTVKKKVDGKKQGRRLGLIGEQARLDWLQRKAVDERRDRDAGFRILSARVTAYRLESEPKTNIDSNGRRMTHLAVQFDGILEVTDPKKFAETVRQGIGSAKGFGFGLLSLSPMP